MQSHYQTRRQVVEEEKTMDLPLDFDINDMPPPNNGKRPVRFRSAAGQAAGNERKRGNRRSKPKTPEQEFAALERSGAPPFLIKTYQLISTCSDDLAEWSDNGETFTVKDTTQFAKVEIPKYFEHNNFSSFSRQLNFYGFRKVPLKTIRVDQGTSTQGHVRFHNENFRKGKIHLLSKIKRSTRKEANANHAQEIKELQDKVDSLQSIIENMTYDYDLLKQQVEQLMNHGISNNAPAPSPFGGQKTLPASTAAASKYPQASLAPHPDTAQTFEYSTSNKSNMPLPPGEGQIGERQFTLSDLNFDDVYDPNAVIDDSNAFRPERVSSIQFQSYAAAVSNLPPPALPERMGSLTLADTNSTPKQDKPKGKVFV